MKMRLFTLVLIAAFAEAQEPATFRARVAIQGKSGPAGDPSNAVIWLTPLGLDVAPPAPKHSMLAQRNKHFEPHLLVVPIGSTVDFPNFDPFFHNVFSMYKGKKFDLGLY